MMAHSREMASPTRTYVAMCVSSNFNGYYFKKFTLPEAEHGQTFENNAEVASWYFLNILDGFACIEGCLTFEDYSKIGNANHAMTVGELL